MTEWQFEDLTALTGAPTALSEPVAFVSEAAGSQHIVYAACDVVPAGGPPGATPTVSSIRELRWDGTGWHDADPTAATGAPPGYPATGHAFDAGGSRHVVYTSHPYDGRIHELWSDSAGWHHTDLTAATNTPPGIPTTSYTREDQGSRHVIYINDSAGPEIHGISPDRHVRELWWNSVGWHHTDLTAAVGAPLLAPLAGYEFRAHGTAHVVCASLNGHIWELWQDIHGWHLHDLTAATGAPEPNWSYWLSGYAFDIQYTQHVVYIGRADGHLHELWWDSAGWHHTDLTAAAGAPAVPVERSAERTRRLTSYACAAWYTRHVLYPGAEPDGEHIHELRWDSTGWHHTDLTAATGAPHLDRGPIGYVFDPPYLRHAFGPEHTQHVVFTSRDPGYDPSGKSHICALWYDTSTEIPMTLPLPPWFTPPPLPPRTKAPRQ
ncbi:hypothetical protein QYS60_21180 [Rhodococcus sp. GXMU-t2271]|uniref:hypothetical protein n=1 Tax=Rhodococcus sp. GXMU-t2271 TaxID=3059079 RepID=UPI00352B9271